MVATVTPEQVKGGVLDRLNRDADAIADRYADELLRTHPLYQSIDDPTFIDVFRAGARHGVGAFAVWAATGADALDADARAYWWVQARQAAEQLVPLEAIHEPVHLGTQYLHQWIHEACGPTVAGQQAAVELTRHLLAHEAAVLSALTSAYMAERFDADAEERHVRREIVENLLGGRRPGVDLAAKLIAGFGLDVDGACVVIVAAPRQPGSREHLEVTAEVLQQQPAGARRLLAVREHELVAVLPVDQPIEVLVDGCRSARDLLHRVHGLELLVGISSPGRIEEVPDRYREARTALKFAAADAGAVAAMPLVRVFDYLVSRADATAQRIVPQELVELLEDDRRGDGGIRATLEALAANDLNVGRTAEALFVHPNTVRYRLKRVADLTGREPRSFHALIDLLVTIRLLDDRN